MRQTENENRFVLLESSTIGDDISSILPQNMRTALQNGIQSASQTITHNHPNPPSDPLSGGRRQTLQERILFNTLAAFAQTLTDTAKEYLLAEFQNIRPTREILKTIAIEYFKVLVNTLDAGLDDIEARINAISAEDTRQLMTGMASSTQNQLAFTINRVVRQFQNTRLPDIPISAAQQAFLSDETNLSEAQRATLENLKCPITYDIMTNPIIVKTTANTHHVYDLSSIESYEAINGQLTQNPMDNSPIQPDQQRWAPCQSTRELIQAFLNTLKLTRATETNTLDDITTNHIISKIIIPERVVTELSASAPSWLLDPFTGKIMDQPVTLDGVTLNLSTLLGKEDIKPLTPVTNVQDQTEYQIILNQGDGTEKTRSFQSISACIQATTSNRLLRTQIIMWITKKCDELNIPYDPVENRNDTSSQHGSLQNSDSSSSSIFNLFTPSQPGTSASTPGLSLFDLQRQIARDNLTGTNQLATDQRNGESALDTLRRRGNGLQPLFESADPNYDGPHGGPTIIYDENGPVNRGSDQTSNNL